MSKNFRQVTYSTVGTNGNRGNQSLPEEIDAQVYTKLDKELVHLAQISGVAMRVQKCGTRHGVTHVNRHYLRPPPRRQPHNFHVFAVRKWAQKQQPSHFIVHQLVRRRIRWKESELRRHRRRHPTHYCVTHSLKVPFFDHHLFIKYSHNPLHMGFQYLKWRT